MSNRTDTHDKIQQITAKLIELNNNFANADALNQIDIDLLRKYTVDLYDEILLLQPQKAVTTPTPEPKVEPQPQPEELPLIAKDESPKAEEIKEAPQPEPKEEPKANYTPQVDLNPPTTQPTNTPQPVNTFHPKVEESMPEPPKVEEVKEEQKVEEKPVAQPVVEEKKEPVAETKLQPEELPLMAKEETPEVEPAKVEEKKEEPAKPTAQPEEVKEKSLNDSLNKAESNDLASKLGQTPIHDLKKAISINKKFEFINQLFKGDHENYTKSIHYLNGLSNKEEAMTFFNSLKKEHEWDEESKRYIEFADLVRRRFM